MDHLDQFLQKFKESKVGIVVDDSTDSPRAVLVSPAEVSSPEIVNKLLHITGGHCFVAVGPGRAASLMLTPMTRHKSKDIGKPTLPLSISVEAREGVSTGISAFDRSTTIKLIGAKRVESFKLVRPGHIFPVLTEEGGLMVKHALPEGALDIVILSGYTDAAVFLDILNKQGEFPTYEEVQTLAKHHSLPITSLADITSHRLKNETIVECVASAKLPTTLGGGLQAKLYKSKHLLGEHIALVKGEIDPKVPTLTRVQPEFTFADVFGGSNPPTRQVLHESLKLMNEVECGVVVYLRRTQKGELKEQVLNWKSRYSDRSSQMMRQYGIGAQILRDLGVKKVELITNSKKSLVGISTFGIEIVSTRSVTVSG